MTLNSKTIANLYINALKTQSLEDQTAFFEYLKPVWNYDLDDNFCNWAVGVSIPTFLSKAFDIGMTRNR